VQQFPSNYYSVKVQKSDFNDVFDLKKALSKVPKIYRVNASKLLNEIESRATELNFDSQGTIFIDGESIQGNIFTFLPYLYRKRIPKALLGFTEFVNKLDSMGLSNLFTVKLNYGQRAKLTDNALQKELPNTSKNWWLLI